MGRVRKVLLLRAIVWIMFRMKVRGSVYGFDRVGVGIMLLLSLDV